MRTSTLLRISLLLGLLLWTSCLRADQQEEAQSGTPAEEADEGEVEDEAEGEAEDEKPGKEKTTEIEEEKDVMVLHINNFARALEENQHLLVEFCKWPQPVLETLMLTLTLTLQPNRKVSWSCREQHLTLTLASLMRAEAQPHTCGLCCAGAGRQQFSHTHELAR